MKDIWEEYKDMILKEIEFEKESGVKNPEILNAISNSVKLIVDMESNNRIH